MQFVLDIARSRGVDPLRIDAEHLSSVALSIDAGGVGIEDDDGEIVTLTAGRGWLRRLAPEDWRDSDPLGYRGTVRSSWVTALMSLVSLSGMKWLSDLDAIHAAEDKLAQQAACLRVGVSTPPVALVTRPELIPEELGNDLVVKPMALGHYRDENGDARVVHATSMHRTDERLELLAGAPFLVQKRVRAVEHLRVVTVGRRSWASSLDARPFPLDWRGAEKAHSSWIAVKRPAVGAAAVRVARTLGVGYSSQDWLVDETGHAHFIDLNPSGQWLFLPDEVSVGVARGIVDWLADGALE